jgi:hypothetical protein
MLQQIENARKATLLIKKKRKMSFKRENNASKISFKVDNKKQTTK